MIYIHIPFCKKKCSYCNFHFSTSFKLKDEMLTAIKSEIGQRREELQNKELQSLYFGGGTPSVLSVDEITSLSDEVQRYFNFRGNIEITLEANPDDLTAPFIKDLRNSDITRLSIGTQSFYDEDLQLMNRAHNASEAESSIKRAQDAGFTNISIDLIYGSPTSSFEVWEKNLNKAAELEVPHLSAYALTVEPKTALQNWIEHQKIAKPDEEIQYREFEYMRSFLKNNGFDHYEISNFAKPGFHSRHNSAYWEYHPYLGIGPSAHSYNGKNIRSWNVANNTKYLKGILQNESVKESEILSENDRFNEMIMIGLRTAAGVNLEKLSAEFGDRASFHEEVKRKTELKQLKIINNRLMIPEEKWFMADGIAADLFII